MQQILLVLLGGAFLAALVTGTVTLIVRNRNRGETVDDNNAAENLAFRRLVQAHALGFDVPLYQAVIQLRNQVDEPAAGWKPLPDPNEFPLYPKGNE